MNRLLLPLTSLIMCLTMMGCKTTPKADPAPTPAETSTSGEASEPARTPSKLEQTDWQSSPPGMPEDSP